MRESMTRALRQSFRRMITRMLRTFLYVPTVDPTVSPTAYTTNTTRALEDRIDLGKLGWLSPAYQDLAWKLLLAEGEISKTGNRNQMRPDVYALRALLKGDASEMYELPRPECFGIGASDATDPVCQLPRAARVRALASADHRRRGQRTLATRGPTHRTRRSRRGSNMTPKKIVRMHTYTCRECGAPVQCREALCPPGEYHRAVTAPRNHRISAATRMPEAPLHSDHQAGEA